MIITQANLISTLAKVSAAKLCGVGRRTEELLDNLGVQTCLDLYQKSPQFLKQNLGKYGLNLYSQLHATESFDALEVEMARE